MPSAVPRARRAAPAPQRPRHAVALGRAKQLRWARTRAIQSSGRTPAIDIARLSSCATRPPAFLRRLHPETSRHREPGSLEINAAPSARRITTRRRLAGGVRRTGDQRPSVRGSIFASARGAVSAQVPPSSPPDARDGSGFHAVRALVHDGSLPCRDGPGPTSRPAGDARSALRGTVRCRPGLCSAPWPLGPRLHPGAAADRGSSCPQRRLSIVPTLCSARLCGPLWVRASARRRALPHPDGWLRQRADLHGDVQLRLGWRLRRWRSRRRIFGLHPRHRLYRLRPSNVAAPSTPTISAISALATLATPISAISALATLATPAPALTTSAASAITLTTAIPAHTTLAPASAAAQTGSAWLDDRGTPRSPAVPSAPGLCAGPPAGRPPDGVRTAQLLGTRASGLRRRAQACSSEARARSSSGALAASVLLEQ